MNNGQNLGEMMAIYLVSRSLGCVLSTAGYPSLSTNSLVPSQP